MAREQLGLFDTPPDRQENRLALLLVGLLFLALIILSALPDSRLRQIDAFIPIVDAIMFLGDMVAATLLYAQASVFRSRALTVLASGFLFESLMLIAHVLTFPGAFSAEGLLGAQVNTTAWIGNFWRAAPSITVMLYVLIRQAEATDQPLLERPSPSIALGVVSTIVLATALTGLVTYGHDLLPQMFLDDRDLNYTNAARVNGVLIALFILALAALFSKRKSVLDLWLLVALSGWLAHALLNLQATARFTVSFYSQFGMLLFSHFVVMLALIAETNRLYARLAVTTATRNREREARLMSMDALAATVSHEVGQPLSAVITNAMAAQSWLDRAQPETAMAIKAMSATIEAGQRTFDVMKSIRATFAAKSPAATEFNLNELVGETILLMDFELTGRKIELEFALEDDLAPVVANRVQIQRVLINLLTNAMEALRPKRRPRSIGIRSMTLDSEHVQLDVSDTGTGITPDKMEQIFEPFFTTKGSGTGLGLSLCRTIVEEHGGHLWASHNGGHGATFHLTLPSKRLVET